MKTQSNIEVRLKGLELKIEDLETQKEINANHGNWQVVKSIKDTVIAYRKEKDLLEWVLAD